MKLVFAIGLVTLSSFQAFCASHVAFWDFTQAPQGWTANRMVTDTRTTTEGWVMEVEAPDPTLVSPPMDWPNGQFGVVTIRMRSTGDGLGQLYHGTNFSELMNWASKSR